MSLKIQACLLWCVVCLLAFGANAVSAQDASLLARNETVGKTVEASGTNPIVISVLPNYYNQTDKSKSKKNRMRRF